MIVFSSGLALTILAAQGFRLNRTSSLPLGVYHISHISTAQPIRGGLVAVCLPAQWSALARERDYIRTGDCPDGSEPLLKRLMAFPGDDVRVCTKGIAVNARLLPESRARMHDRHGRTMPRALHSGRIPLGYALVLAPTPDSFDSRYIGLVPLSGLRSAQPVFTLGSKALKLEGVAYGTQ